MAPTSNGDKVRITYQIEWDGESRHHDVSLGSDEAKAVDLFRAVKERRKNVVLRAKTVTTTEEWEEVASA